MASSKDSPKAANAASSAKATSSVPSAAGQVVQIVGPVPFGAEPQVMTCPQCLKSVETSTTFVTGTMTWAIFALLLVTTLCCCLAFCSDCTKDVEHRCPNCNHFFGQYNRCG